MATPGELSGGWRSPGREPRPRPGAASPVNVDSSPPPQAPASGGGRHGRGRRCADAGYGKAGHAHRGQPYHAPWQDGGHAVHRHPALPTGRRGAGHVHRNRHAGRSFGVHQGFGLEVVDHSRAGSLVTLRLRYRSSSSACCSRHAVIDPRKLVWVETVTDLAAQRHRKRVVSPSSTTPTSPGQQPGWTTARPAGSATRRVVGDLKVNVFLVGSQVETGDLGQFLREHLAEEAERARCSACSTRSDHPGSRAVAYVALRSIILRRTDRTGNDCRVGPGPPRGDIDSKGGDVGADEPSSVWSPRSTCVSSTPWMPFGFTQKLVLHW